jgi:hypothetical protein
MKEIIKERNARLEASFPNIENKRDLYGEITLPHRLFFYLQDSFKIVVYDCLASFFKNEYFDLNLPIEKFFEKYQDFIIQLPNITPNGLLLPKIEILNSINLFNKNVFRLIEHINPPKNCHIACPVNIRLNFGILKGTQHFDRPKSSTIWHTDIWAGQNSNEVMVHTPIFGDFRTNGIKAAKPRSGFYPNYIKCLNNYNDAKHLIENLDKDAYKTQLETRKSYLFDSFLLHRTVSEASGIRGILSFSIKFTDLISSDIYQNPLRDDEFESYSNWEKMGKNIMLTSNKKLESSNWKDESKIVYADKFSKIIIS